jgi:transcriptional regulator with XRE-family HTH domain
VNGDARRRRELGTFLGVRRKQLVRADLGLPEAGRRLTGLRREEVAHLSGVSLTWYTWLEQGREITPSRQVLDAIARTLRLSGPEHAYVLALSGYSATELAPDPGPTTLPAHVRRLLDALGDLPAYVLTPNWKILEWTPAFAACYPNIATVSEEDRNLLWLVFTDPYLRELQADWQLHCSRHLAEFRAELGPRLGEPPLASLVERLHEASEFFRTIWENHDVEGFASGERIYHNPVAGDLHFEVHRMAISGHSNLHIVVYMPVPGTGTAARLRQFLDGEARLRAG